MWVLSLHACQNANECLRAVTGLNLVGFVWSVDQDTHNTVTVEFYDRERYRDFHFTDPFLYDKACLS